MLKIQYCSDLHLEFPENKLYLQKHPLEALGDVLILAGDIVPFVALNEADWFFSDLSNRFEQVYWIPGNHEYYFSNIQKRTGSFCEKIYKNVFLLNNQEVEIEGVHFVFSTLWSNISAVNKLNVAQRLSDFYVIKKGTGKFSPTHYNKLYLENLSFIQNALSKKSHSEKTVVVTHHVPTYLEYPEKYKGDALNEAFAVELFEFIEENKPDYWIFGHHHVNIKPFKIGSTQLLTNQLGYVKYKEHQQFSTSSIISI